MWTAILLVLLGDRGDGVADGIPNGTQYSPEESEEEQISGQDADGGEVEPDNLLPGHSICHGCGCGNKLLLCSDCWESVMIEASRMGTTES